jgi:broad specificity phosphatase PhoE
LSTLVVVRHGQASFLADNYDKLSQLGERQARLLGEYWARRGERFDRVYYGPCERQARTGEIAGQALEEAGLGWPEAVVDPEFDEFPAEPVMRGYVPALMERHPHIRELIEAFYAAAEFEPKRRVFDKLLREVSLRWLAREVDVPGVPTWGDFCQRIEGGIGRIRRECGRGARIALFTSAGPMAATARLALELTEHATMELTWSPRNAAFSEFLYTEARFSMSTFNETPHLAGDPALITWR